MSYSVLAPQGQPWVLAQSGLVENVHGLNKGVVPHTGCCGGQGLEYLTLYVGNQGRHPRRGKYGPLIRLKS